VLLVWALVFQLFALNAHPIANPPQSVVATAAWQRRGKELGPILCGLLHPALHAPFDTKAIATHLNLHFCDAKISRDHSGSLLPCPFVQDLILFGCPAVLGTTNFAFVVSSAHQGSTRLKEL
jgi:hypothetical protein